MRFESSSPYFLSLEELKKKKKVIETKTKDFLRFSSRRAFLYDPSYSLDRGILKKVAERRRALILIGLDFIYYKRGIEKSKAIERLRIYISLLLKYGLPFFPASLSRSVDEVRSYREKVYSLIFLGVPFNLAKRYSKLLEEVLE